jgi:Taurine catabolism dioxygenase TauD, TfdA family
MSHNPRVLESRVVWHSEDVADPAAWTVTLTADDHRELDAALATAKRASNNLLDIDRRAFPLDRLAQKLSRLERELVDGRGFARISALDVDRYNDDDLTLLYWGIGLALGEPWPQNQHGHLMGDVTDQGRLPTDPQARGNELGSIELDYHTDGSDLVGLMCLRTAKTGGLSCVANAVAIHNELLRERPDLAEVLYQPMPYDFRGEQPPGGKPYYTMPVFTDFDDRLFVRFIPQYIKASQRHPDAPRLAPLALEALDRVSAMARDPRMNVYMDLRPGEMQFINNYHVLHGRSAYVDDPVTGHKRHFKRLWLACPMLEYRPPHFRRKHDSHWGRRLAVSNIAPSARASGAHS